MGVKVEMNFQTHVLVTTDVTNGRYYDPPLSTEALKAPHGLTPSNFVNPI
jgi:hypothetical protein